MIDFRTCGNDPLIGGKPKSGRFDERGRAMMKSAAEPRGHGVPGLEPRDEKGVGGEAGARGRRFDELGRAMVKSAAEPRRHGVPGLEPRDEKGVGWRGGGEREAV